MTISIRKTWFAVVVVATLAVPAAQAHPLAEGGASNTGTVKATVVAEHNGQPQAQITAMARGARERAAERSAAAAVPAAASDVVVHVPQAQPQSMTIVRALRERALEKSAAYVVSTASPSVASAGSEGFHLRDAGIGAAVTVGALMLGGALALAFIGRTRRRAVHA